LVEVDAVVTNGIPSPLTNTHDTPWGPLCES